MMLMLRSLDNPNDSLVLVNTQLYHGDEQDFVRHAQSLYLLEKGANFIRNHYLQEENNKRKHMKVKVKSLTQKEKQKVCEK